MKAGDQIKHSISEENGSFLLFLGIAVVPILLVFGSVGLTVLKVNKEFQSAQKTIDRAALSATKKLPFVSEARKSAEAILQRDGLNLQKVSLTVTTSSVSIVYDTTMPSLARRLIGDREISSFHVAASTETAINAKDVAIFVDASSYMAPVPTKNAEWYNHDSNSSNGDAWPEARFFKRLQNQSNAITVNGKKVSARALTQQCFNSAFSANKDASIRLLDYYSANQDNSVGVLVGPSVNGNVSIIRNIKKPGDTNTSAGEGRFEYYQGQQGYNRDELCLATAKFAPERHAGYLVPPRGNSNFWPAPYVQDAPFSIMNNLSTTLAPALVHQLSVRDIIWTLAVRREQLNTPRTVNFLPVLRKTTNMLIGAPHRSERAGMNHKTSKIGILMMGDIPWIKGTRLVPHHNNLHRKVDQKAQQQLKRELKHIEERAAGAGVRLQLYISVTKHHGNYPTDTKGYENCVSQNGNGSAAQCPQFVTDTARLAKILENNGISSTGHGYMQGEHLQIQILRSPDTEALARSLPAWLPLFDRTVMKIR